MCEKKVDVLVGVEPLVQHKRRSAARHRRPRNDAPDELNSELSLIASAMGV